MPRAGGIFSLIPGYFAVDGTTIEVSQHNPVFEDVAQALTDSLPRDGSAPMTGNLAMGSNKITGLAAGTTAGDAVRFDQLPSITPTTAALTAGTNAQGQGPITTDQATITTAAANPSGVTLPTAVAGDRVIIANRGANPVNIYPAAGAAIGALATNAPVLLAVNQSVEFFARSATQWEGQISQPLDADLTAIAAPTYVRGDIITRGPSALGRLPLGAAGQNLVSDGTDLVYSTAMTYTNVTGSRAVNTNYTNAGNRPMAVIVHAVYTSANTVTNLLVDTVVLSSFGIGNGLAGLTFTHSVIVPPGSTYQLNQSSGAATINSWREALL